MSVEEIFEVGEVVCSKDATYLPLEIMAIKQDKAHCKFYKNSKSKKQWYYLSELTHKCNFEPMPIGKTNVF